MNYKIIQDSENATYKDGDKIRIEVIYNDGTSDIKNYKFIKKETVYKWIKEEKDINLNETYIKDFSLKEYRKIYDLDTNEYVTINNLSARSAFFDCTYSVDFSYAQFNDNNKYFDNTFFGNGDVSFTYAKFNNGDVFFTDSNFGTGNVSFTDAIFGNGKVFFTDAKLGNGNVFFSYTEFGNGDVSFTDTKFGEGNISFRDAKFGIGTVSFTDAQFGEGDLHFSFAKFDIGDIYFNHADFGKGKVDFSNVNFNNGLVDFTGTTYGEGEDLFNNAVFGNGDVYFTDINFGEGKVDFTNVKFGEGKVDFTDSDFGNGNVHFENVDFNKGDVFFYGDIFGSGNVSFSETIVANALFIDCHFNSYTNFNFKQCSYLYLNGSIIRDIIEVDNVKGINLSGVKNLGKIYIDWDKNNVKDLILSQKDTSHKEKAEQFRIIKENYRKIGEYDQEDKAYLNFKKQESKSELEQLKIKKFSIKKILKIIKFWLVMPLKKLIFDWMGGYGTKPLRIIYSMGITWFIFTLLYRYSGAKIMKKVTLAKSAYYSAITFLTIGYGDIYPQDNLATILSSMEGFIGLFLMSYFTVVFARKVLR